MSAVSMEGAADGCKLDGHRTRVGADTTRAALTTDRSPDLGLDLYARGRAASACPSSRSRSDRGEAGRPSPPLHHVVGIPRFEGRSRRFARAEGRVRESEVALHLERRVLLP